jgi:hypothetical protein
MRRARVDLEREHARILRQSPAKLFDQEAIRAGAREDDIYVDNTDPVFLVLASKARRVADEPQSLPLAGCMPWGATSGNSVAAWAPRA